MLFSERLVRTYLPRGECGDALECVLFLGGFCVVVVLRVNGFSVQC